MSIVAAPIPPVSQVSRLALIYSENFEALNKQIVVPAGQLWRPIAMRATFTASAQVANRIPHMGMTFEPGGKTIYAVYPNAFVKAGEKWRLRIFLGLGDPNMTAWGGIPTGDTFSGTIHLPMLPAILEGGNKLYCEALGEQTEDKWSEPSLVYERLQ